MTDEKTSPTAAQDFQSESQSPRIGFFSELWGFLKHNKKWWLLPIIVVLLLLGLLVMLSGTAVAPFLYPLF